MKDVNAGMYDRIQLKQKNKNPRGMMRCDIIQCMERKMDGNHATAI